MCTKNKSNLSTVQRETQRQNFAQIKPLIFAPDTDMLMCRVLKVYILYELKVWLINGGYCIERGFVFLLFFCFPFFLSSENQRYLHRSRKERFGFCSVMCWRIQRWKAEEQRHRLHLDNLPIHSTKCSCYKYDGVLLLMIIITVMVIINNYLMM